MIKRYTLLLIIMCVPLLFFFIGCSKQKVFQHKPESRLICIEMPRSINIFESITYDFYTTLFSHLKRKGFAITKNNNEAEFVLKTTLNQLDTNDKLISPDMVPYLLNIDAILLCELYDKHHRLVASKKFHTNRWIDRPRNIRLSSHFFTFEYRKLFEKLSGYIDYWLRPHVVNVIQS